MIYIVIKIIDKMQNYKYQVLALRIENILVEKYDIKKYILLLKQDTNYYELSMNYCPILKHGIYQFDQVNKFCGMSYNVKDRSNNIVDLEEIIDHQNNNSYIFCQNEFFSFSNYQSQDNCDNQNIKINIEKFKTHIFNPRIKNKRMVWIFYGSSGLGKTYLSAKINNSDSSMSSYETDQSEILPEKIFEPVIVVGNKYKFSIEEIKEHIYDLENCEVVSVNFSKS